MKVCSQCQKRKSLQHFYSRAASADGFTAACGQCLRMRRKQAYHEGRTNDRDQGTAYHRALERLRENHRSEFELLYGEERTARGLPVKEIEAA